MMFYFLDEGFWQYPGLIGLFIISLACVIFLRYFLVSVIYKYFLEQTSGTTRNSFVHHTAQIKTEIKWAIISSLVFTVVAAFSFWAYQHNLTLIYSEIKQYSILYFLISPFLILAVYETYYYWLHRWMHRPGVFTRIHKVHHDSLLPTVFTAFSFHPVEAFLQFIFFPVYLMIIPIHPYMLGIVFLVLTVTAMVNHGGVEVAGRLTARHLIGSRHHDLHHKLFRRNFGLNVTWWDKWMKTEEVSDSEVASTPANTSRRSESAIVE